MAFANNLSESLLPDLLGGSTEQKAHSISSKEMVLELEPCLPFQVSRKFSLSPKESISLCKNAPLFSNSFHGFITTKRQNKSLMLNVVHSSNMLTSRR